MSCTYINLHLITKNVNKDQYSLSRMKQHSNFILCLFSAYLRLSYCLHCHHPVSTEPSVEINEVLYVRKQLECEGSYQCLQ
jgi:hypothetical protein